MGLRLLVYGVPGTPIFEVCDRISDFYELDYFTIEKVSEKEDGYFSDKIEEVDFDTGDFMTGSESQHMVRDPGSLRFDREMEDRDAFLSELGEFYEDELDPRDLSIVFSMEEGIVATEVPDLNLVNWANRIIFFTAKEDGIVDWFSNRRHCPSCKSIYHLKEKVPLVRSRCDRCGTDLVLDDRDSASFVRDQFRNWRNSFWKFEERSKESGCYKVLNLDKLRDFSDVVSRVNLWVRGDI
jgi:hypothetical protein